MCHDVRWVTSTFLPLPLPGTEGDITFQFPAVTCSLSFLNVVVTYYHSGFKHKHFLFHGLSGSKITHSLAKSSSVSLMSWHPAISPRSQSSQGSVWKDSLPGSLRWLLTGFSQVTGSGALVSCWLSTSIWASTQGSSQHTRWFCQNSAHEELGAKSESVASTIILEVTPNHVHDILFIRRSP